MSRYDDILHFDHPVSKTHPQMSMIARAAQFMPFAALTGYESALDESVRVTEDRIENGDADNEMLNESISKEMMLFMLKISTTISMNEIKV